MSVSGARGCFFGALASEALGSGVVPRTSGLGLRGWRYGPVRDKHGGLLAAWVVYVSVLCGRVRAVMCRLQRAGGSRAHGKPRRVLPRSLLRPRGTLKRRHGYERALGP